MSFQAYLADATHGASADLRKEQERYVPICAAVTAMHARGEGPPADRSYRISTGDRYGGRAMVRCSHWRGQLRGAMDAADGIAKGDDLPVFVEDAFTGERWSRPVGGAWGSEASP